MGVQARVGSISRDIDLMVRETLSPAAQSKVLANFAREKLAEAQQVNKKALGVVPAHRTFVDGARSDRLDGVKPNGVIVFQFSLVIDAVRWIAEQLETHSPKRSGEYARSHALFADGSEVSVGDFPENAKVLAFVNTVPYARKIERGLSNQAPEGVYEVVSVLAARRFGNIARIRFSYRSIAGSAKDQNTRQPAIVITV